MIDVELIGETELAARFEAMPPLVRRVLGNKMRSEVQVLLAAVKSNLDEYAESTLENHGPTNQLANSLRTAVDDTIDTITGRVWPDEGLAPYARTQEYGAPGGAELRPVSATVMAFIYRGEERLESVLIRGETPAKRYLRNALADTGPGIAERLVESVQDAVASGKE